MYYSNVGLDQIIKQESLGRTDRRGGTRVGFDGNWEGTEALSESRQAYFVSMTGSAAAVQWSSV